MIKEMLKDIVIKFMSILLIFGIIYLFKYIGLKGVIGYLLGSSIMAIIFLTKNPTILALLTLIGIRNHEERKENYIKRENPNKVKFK